MTEPPAPLPPESGSVPRAWPGVGATPADEAGPDDDLPTLSPIDALPPEALAPEPPVESPPVASPPDASPPDASASALSSRVPGRPRTAGASSGGEETTIPMLTEIVQVPRYAREELPASLEEVDWAELAERIRENVTERLSRRAQALLDAQLRESLAVIVDRATESLAAELRDAVSRMVGDIVGRAVNEELTRVHAEIARRGNP